MRRPSVVHLSLLGLSSSLITYRIFTNRTNSYILSGFSSVVAQSADPRMRSTVNDKNVLYPQRQSKLHHKQSNPRKYASILEAPKTNISFSNEAVEVHELVANDQRGTYINHFGKSADSSGSPTLASSTTSCFVTPVKFSKTHYSVPDRTPHQIGDLPQSALQELEVQQKEIREMFQRRPHITVNERKKDPKTNQYIFIKHEIPLLPVEYLNSKYYRPFIQRKRGMKVNSTLSLMLSDEERLHHITQLNKLGAIENTKLTFRCLRCFCIFDGFPKKVLKGQVGTLSSMEALKDAQDNRSAALSKNNVTPMDSQPPRHLMRMCKRNNSFSKLRPDEIEQFQLNGITSKNYTSGCPKCGSEVQWLMEYQHRKNHTMKKK
eukprot:Tbor_TRINITY_DN4321_c0_g1::TRINITY_DN4321_c0_g1_i1::g.7855::m.7855